MEIEAKFQTSDPDLLDALAEVGTLAGYSLSEPVVKNITDTYLDSHQSLMLAAGYTCRRRLGLSKTLITIKRLQRSSDLVHRRDEYEVEIGAFVPWSEWPESEARELLARIVDGEPLEELMTLTQSRTIRLVGDSDQPLVELSLDRVEVLHSQIDLTPEAAEGRISTFYEVEVELKPAGTEEDLNKLASALRDEWKLTAQPLSKFEHALLLSRQRVDDVAAGAVSEPVDGELPAPEIEPKKHNHKHGKGHRFLGDGLAVLEKPGLSPDDTMAEAANKTLLYHLQRMMHHEPGTRDGEDAEELHDMRVATRRMRAAVRVFGDHLDADVIKPYLRVMRQTGRELGTVRDLDVFRIKAQANADSLPEGQQSSLDPLFEAWEIERARARAELVAFLDENKYQLFKEKFEHFLRTPGAGAKREISADGEPLPVRVRDILPGVVFERLAMVRAFDKDITSGAAPIARFHQLRIASKGLRYTLEFFQEVLGPDSKRLIDVTKRVQDHLGDLQDASVACEVLLGFLASGTWGTAPKGAVHARPVNAPGVATYLAVNQHEIDTLMGTFEPLWQEIRGPEFSLPLAKMVGAL
jgi:CHAD domain-containing protein